MNMVKRIAVVFFAMVLVLSMAVPAFAAGSTNLVNMHDVGSSDVEEVDGSITDSYGNTYSGNILRFEAGKWASISYDLNGSYEKFDATVVCPTDAGSNAVMDVAFFGDGVLLGDITGYSRQKAAETISIDVSGVGIFEIRTHGSEYWYSPLCFVNSSFIKSENSVPYPNRTKLADLVVIDSQNSECGTGLCIDNLGDYYDGWVKFTTGDNRYSLFNLNKSYETLSGCIVAGDEMKSDASASVTFYLDDKEVLKKENIQRTSQVDFEIDVENASVLKIVVSGTNYWYSPVYVANPILKAHEHTIGEWETTIEATCTKNGEKVQICKDCGEVVTTEKIPATGHTADTKWTVTKEATCTERGEQIHKCTVCGEAADTGTIEAKGHTANGSWEYGDDGTCNKVQKCTVCGDVALRQTDEEAEHTLSGEWTITREARCDAEGKQVQYCTICNAIGLTEAIPTTEHDYGKWTTISGSVWNNPIVKERTCSICGDVEHVESNSTSWLKPLVIVLFVIIFGGLAVIIVTLKMNGLALEPASIKKLFSKESLTDDDIDNILNKPDDNSDNQ